MIVCVCVYTQELLTHAIHGNNYPGKKKRLFFRSSKQKRMKLNIYIYIYIERNRKKF